MSEKELPTVSARLTAQLNLGDYNLVKFELSVTDSVREDRDEGKTTKAVDRLTSLLDAKIETWAKGYKDD